MIGYPKHINTKDDLLYVLSEFPNDSRNKEFLQSLLADRFGWYTTELTGEGVNDATHKVVENTELSVWFYVPKTQYELRENPTARIFQMGLAVEEVQGMIVK